MTRALVPIVALFACVGCACESRVLEPTPSHDPSASSRSGATASAAESASPMKLDSPRCVRRADSRPLRAPAAVGSDPRCPADPSGNAALARATVSFPDTGDQVAVEVAEKDEHRRRGLMYRTVLGEDAGMLFVFEREQPLSFWMRNTCLPLDMLFLDKDGYVVGIEAEVPTLNDGSYGFDCPAKYVLEVNAGWSRRHGVEPGQRAHITR
ncbi:MAG: DUF192 domain-containing protein [Myxococcales bacterium]|nr:DUF192 domain-containing protein [Myxococcales bacterium]